MCMKDLFHFLYAATSSCGGYYITTSVNAKAILMPGAISPPEFV